MEKILNQILDLPQMVNQKLPKNTFNNIMEGSEGSFGSWAGTFYKIGALVVLIGILVAAITGGIDAINSAEGLGKVTAVICMLILIYAAFPIAQTVRSAGDSLGESKNGIVDFIFRDLIVANIKLAGHAGALVALFGAFCATLGWLLMGSDPNIAIAPEFFAGIAYSVSLPISATAEFLSMIRLDFVGGVLNDFNAWDVTSSDAAGYNIGGIVAVGWEYVQVTIVLAKLYVSLALYHFLYGLLSTLVSWIKNPSLPIKTS